MTADANAGSHGIRVRHLYWATLLTIPILTVAAILLATDPDRAAIEAYVRDGQILTSPAPSGFLQAFVNTELANEHPKEGFHVNTLPQDDLLTFYVLSADPRHRFGHATYNASYVSKVDAVFVDSTLVAIASSERSDQLGSHARRYLRFILLHELGHRHLHRNRRLTFDALPYGADAYRSTATPNEQKEEIEADRYAIQRFVTDSVRNPKRLTEELLNLVEASILTQLSQNGPFSALADAPTHPSLLARSANIYRTAAVMLDEQGAAEDAKLMRSEESRLAGLLDNIQAHVRAILTLPMAEYPVATTQDDSSLFVLSGSGFLYKVSLEAIEAASCATKRGEVHLGNPLNGVRLGDTSSGSLSKLPNGDLAYVSKNGDLTLFPADKSYTPSTQNEVFKSSYTSPILGGHLVFTAEAVGDNSDELDVQQVDLCTMKKESRKFDRRMGLLKAESLKGEDAPSLSDVVFDDTCVMAAISSGDTTVVKKGAFADGAVTEVCRLSKDDSLEYLQERGLLLVLTPDRTNGSVLVKGMSTAGQVLWTYSVEPVASANHMTEGFIVKAACATAKGRIALAMPGRALVVFDPSSGKTVLRDSYCSRPDLTSVLSTPDALLFNIPYSRFLLVAGVDQ